MIGAISIGVQFGILGLWTQLPGPKFMKTAQQKEIGVFHCAFLMASLISNLHDPSNLLNKVKSQGVVNPSSQRTWPPKDPLAT